MISLSKPRNTLCLARVTPQLIEMQLTPPSLPGDHHNGSPLAVRRLSAVRHPRLYGVISPSGVAHAEAAMSSESWPPRRILRDELPSCRPRYPELFRAASTH